MFESFNVPGLYIAVQVRAKLFLQFPTDLSCVTVEEMVNPKALCCRSVLCVLIFPLPEHNSPTPFRHCKERVP